MHSPDPDSGSSSVSDNEETFQAPTGGPASILSHLTSSFTASPSKRRLPAGSSFAGSSSRDVKSRRREDPRRGGWEMKEGGGKRDKEELVDPHIVDTFRKEIGDPFNEANSKAMS